MRFGSVRKVCVAALWVVAVVVFAAGCTRAGTAVAVRADGTATVTVAVATHPSVAAAVAAATDSGPVGFADQIGIRIPADAAIDAHSDRGWDGWAATFDVASPDALSAVFADTSGTITVVDGVWSFDVQVAAALLDEIAGSGDTWGQVDATVTVSFAEVIDAGTGTADGNTLSWDLADPAFDGRIVATGTGTGAVTGGDHTDTPIGVVGAVVLVAGVGVAGVVGYRVVRSRRR